LRLLLDTHAFLWFVLDDAKLSLPARQAIESVDNEVVISPASYWEIAIKISLGKYRLSGSFERFWDTGMRRNDITALPPSKSATRRGWPQWPFTTRIRSIAW
jgi:PIN domain nuclease of toxin-antitoxin system